MPRKTFLSFTVNFLLKHYLFLRASQLNRVAFNELWYFSCTDQIFNTWRQRVTWEQKRISRQPASTMIRKLWERKQLCLTAIDRSWCLLAHGRLLFFIYKCYKNLLLIANSMRISFLFLIFILNCWLAATTQISDKKQYLKQLIKQCQDIDRLIIDIQTITFNLDQNVVLAGHLNS